MDSKNKDIELGLPLDEKKTESLRKNISDDIKKQLILHKMQREDNENEVELQNHYQSCCGLVLDARVVRLFSRLIIIFFVLLFCMYQTLRVEEVSERTSYFNIIVMVLGAFLSPISKDATKSNKGKK